MDLTTLTANLKSLEQRGLVAISCDPADRPGRLLALTEAGHAVLLAAVPIGERTQKSVERVVPQPSRAALRARLKALA